MKKIRMPHFEGSQNTLRAWCIGDTLLVVSDYPPTLNGSSLHLKYACSKFKFVLINGICIHKFKHSNNKVYTLTTEGHVKSTTREEVRRELRRKKFLQELEDMLHA